MHGYYLAHVLQALKGTTLDSPGSAAQEALTFASTMYWTKDSRPLAGSTQENDADSVDASAVCAEPCRAGQLSSPQGGGAFQSNR